MCLQYFLVIFFVLRGFRMNCDVIVRTSNDFKCSTRISYELQYLTTFYKCSQWNYQMIPNVVTWLTWCSPPHKVAWISHPKPTLKTQGTAPRSHPLPSPPTPPTPSPQEANAFERIEHALLGDLWAWFFSDLSLVPALIILALSRWVLEAWVRTCPTYQKCKRIA